MTDHMQDHVTIQNPMVMNNTNKERSFYFEVVIPDKLVHQSLLRSGVNRNDLINYYDHPERVEEETKAAIEQRLNDAKPALIEKVGNRFAEMLLRDVDAPEGSPLHSHTYTLHGEGGFTQKYASNGVHRLTVPIFISDKNGPLGIVEHLEHAFKEHGARVSYCDNHTPGKKTEHYESVSDPK